MDSKDFRLESEESGSRNLVDKVEKRLIEVFLNKELKPGDSIPKETELSAFMGVSRTVIRESLNRLKTMGLIELKKHKGTIIKKSRPVSHSGQIIDTQNTRQKDTDGHL